jgi:four helix bundle protein
MQRFTDLAVWRRSHELALAVYKQTKPFPAEERFGLTSQLRRAAISVSANIAEGSKRRSAPDYVRFLNIAEGSAAETEALLMLARDLEFLPVACASELLEEVDHVSRMLSSLRSKVERGVNA